ncbi:hypothetical protein F7725_007769, partial [Dissostichus mawsoni]
QAAQSAVQLAHSVRTRGSQHSTLPWSSTEERTEIDELPIPGHFDGGAHCGHLKVLDELNPALNCFWCQRLFLEDLDWRSLCDTLVVMTDFWLISVPLDKTSLTSVEKLKRNLAKTNLVSCCRFSIPELKVGILDSLLSVSDDLSKLDTLTESVIKKTHQCMREVMEQSDDKVLENALANGVDLMSYMTKFQWDKAKYPTALPLSSLADIITKEVSQMETELKSRAAAYSSVKTSLQSMEYKLQGSYLQWERTYESFSQFVVPRSSRAVCEFKAKAQESKFTVREYSFDLEAKQEQERQQRSVHKKEQYVNFSQVFIAWIHLKALRVFAESVLRSALMRCTFIFSFNRLETFNLNHFTMSALMMMSPDRYGLPVNYQALLLHTDKKRSKKLREDLASLFKHLDPTASNSKTDQVSFDIPGLCQPEYLSYICFYINTNLLELS